MKEYIPFVLTLVFSVVTFIIGRKFPSYLKIKKIQDNTISDMINRFYHKDDKWLCIGVQVDKLLGPFGFDMRTIILECGEERIEFFSSNNLIKMNDIVHLRRRKEEEWQSCYASLLDEFMIPEPC